MKFLKVFYLFFACYSAVLAVDDNTILPLASTLAAKQQKIQFAVGKNRDAFITKISKLHSPTVDVPTLQIIPPVAAPGHVIPQSYFNTSDIKIIDYYIRRVIHYALQDPEAGQQNPQHVIITQSAQNNVIIECNLRNSGDLPLYLQQDQTNGIGRNMVPDALHPLDVNHTNGWLTDCIKIIIQKRATGWEMGSAYPFGYN